MRHFLNHYSILPSRQSGFRTGYSCETALADVTKDVFRALDENKTSILVLLDFSKAFDTLNHQLLLAILRYIGFGDSACQLVHSFLSDRTQQVVLNSQRSTLLNILIGVSQGNILGPLFYTVYTFNFFKPLQHCKSHFYVDDTQIYLSFSDNEIDQAKDLINSDLNSFYTTDSDHLLKLNPSKSLVIILGTNFKLIKLKLTSKLNCFILP